MADLDPAPGLLLSEFENDPSSATVTATGFDGAAAMSWSVSPAFPEGVDVAVGGGTVTVSWQLVIDLFPIQAIRYLQHPLDENTAEVQAWADLPPDAAEITEFRADPINMHSYTLTVTATGTAGGQPASAAGTYMVEIWHQYDTNRGIMQGEIDARR